MSDLIFAANAQPLVAKLISLHCKQRRCKPTKFNQSFSTRENNSSGIQPIDEISLSKLEN